MQTGYVTNGPTLLTTPICMQMTTITDAELCLLLTAFHFSQAVCKQLCLFSSKCHTQSFTITLDA